MKKLEEPVERNVLLCFIGGWAIATSMLILIPSVIYNADKIDKIGTLIARFLLGS